MNSAGGEEVSALPPPSLKTQRGARLIGGPWHNEVVPIVGACLVGPTAAFENGFISRPVGRYIWDGSLTEGYFGEWQNCSV